MLIAARSAPHAKPLERRKRRGNIIPQTSDLFNRGSMRGLSTKRGRPEMMVTL
jgi:hypothetical protein